MNFSNFSLRNKLIAILLPLGFVYAIAIGFFFLDTTDTLISNTSMGSIKSNSVVMQNLIADYETKALSIATLFAQNQSIQSAYLNPDEVAGSNELMLAITPLINEIKKDTKIKDFQIHYHKAPAKSFLRSWTNKRFDDLSTFRPTILEVNRTKASLKAIEFGVGGFAIRGLAPIIIEGNYLGSVEFLYDIKDILGLFATDVKTNDMFNIVSSEIAEIALTEKQIEEFYSLKIGDYFVSKQSAQWFSTNELLDEKVVDLMKNTNELIVENIGDIYYSLNPIFDMNNKKIGYVAFVINNEKLSNHQFQDILIKVILILVLVMMFIGAIILLIDRFILRSVRTATRMAQEIASGKLENYR